MAPLVGLWWGSAATDLATSKAESEWTTMQWQPRWLDDDALRQAITVAWRKKGPPAPDAVLVLDRTEGSQRLSNPDRGDPAKLKTVLRQPVKAKN